MTPSPPVPRSIRGSGERELEVRRSRFLCAVARVDTEAGAREFLQGRRKEHFAAGHHCSAYVLGVPAETQKSSDDGEPAGTAGVPMLEVLRKRGLTDTVAVVSRYFGGVKLGAGGLIRAYSGALAATIDSVGIVERRPVLVVSVAAEYPHGGRLENELRGSAYPVRDVHYTDTVRLRVAVPEPELAEFTMWIAELTAGTAVSTVDGTDITDVPV